MILMVMEGRRTRGLNCARANESTKVNGMVSRKKVVCSSEQSLSQAGMCPREGCFLCFSRDRIANNRRTESRRDWRKIRR